MLTIATVACAMLLAGTDSQFVPYDNNFAVRLQWSLPASRDSDSKHEFFEDHLFINENENSIAAVNIFNGARKWTIQLAYKVLDMRMAGRKLRVLTDNGTVYDLHPEQGTILDTINTGIKPISSGGIIDGAIIICSDSAISCFDTEKQSIRWSKDAKTPKIISDSPFLYESEAALIHANLSSGDQISRLTLENTGGKVTTCDDRVAIANGGKLLIANPNLLAEPISHELGDDTVTSAASFINGDRIIVVRTRAEGGRFAVLVESFSLEVGGLSAAARRQAGVKLNASREIAAGYYNNPKILKPLALNGTHCAIIINDLIYTVDLDTLATIGNPVATAQDFISICSYHNSFLFVLTPTHIYSYKSGITPPQPVRYSYYERLGEDSVKIYWSGANDPEGGDMSYYMQYHIGKTDPAAFDITVSEDPVLLGSGINEFQILQNIGERACIQWRIRVKDSSDTWSEWSQLYSYVISSDKTPPSSPVFLNVLPQNRAVTVEFSRSASDDSYYYNLYYKWREQSWSDAMLVTQVPSSPFILKNLQNGVPYQFGVTTVDYNLNESTPMIVVDGSPAPDIMLNGKYTFATLQEAIDYASDNDTIILNKNIFEGGITIDKPLTIIGASPKDTIIQAHDADSAVITVDISSGGQAVLQAIRIASDGANATGINVIRGSLTAKNVLITNIRGSAVNVSEGAKVLVKNATLSQNEVAIRSRAVDTAVKNCVIIDNALAFDAAPDIPYSYNAISNNAMVFTQTNNINLATNITNRPLFAIINGENLFLELPESPTVDSGDPSDPVENELAPNGGRINIGAFGGTVYAASKSWAALFRQFTGKESSGSLPDDIATLAGIKKLSCYLLTPCSSFDKLVRINALKESFVAKTTLGRAAVNIYASSAPAAAARLVELPFLSITRYMTNLLYGIFFCKAVLCLLLAAVLTRVR